MTSYSGLERRRSPRVTYPFEIWYKDHNKNYQGFKHAYGKDISEHGLLFETYESFPPCTILEIRLELSSSKNSNESFTPLEVIPTRRDVAVPARGGEGGLLTGFNVLAEVVRSEEVKHQWLYHIGISFCRIDEDCRRFLREYILKSRDIDRRELVGTA